MMLSSGAPLFGSSSSLLDVSMEAFKPTPKVSSVVSSQDEVTLKATVAREWLASRPWPFGKAWIGHDRSLYEMECRPRK